jgi:hypothetical protein
MVSTFQVTLEIRTAAGPSSMLQWVLTGGADQHRQTCNTRGVTQDQKIAGRNQRKGHSGSVIR